MTRLHRSSRFTTWAGISVAAATMLAAPATLLAQAQFPSKPVTLVVPFAPGGGSDVVARTLQPRLSALLGTPVLVDNKSSASGIVATNFVAKAPPDGHTLFLSWDNHSINPVINKDLPYDTAKDFAPVTLLVRLPLVMGAWAGLPANSVQEFIALAKRQPGKLNYASVGSGSSNRLVSENLNRLAGIDVAHIPYKGGGPSMVAMIAGEVAYSYLSYASLRGHIASGKIKPLAVTSARRMPDLPNVPTMIESGFPGFEAYGWIGIFAPAGTPEAVIARLNRDFLATLAEPEVRQRIAGIGAESVGSTPQELDAFWRKEFEFWEKFVRETRLKFE
ncbi:MAG: tripartite tricarboxylate transporter substrate binding protein [Burkholderiales bacterium]